MMGPHWNPETDQVAIVLQGQGMVQVVCPGIASETGCENLRFNVQEGDVFVVPKSNPMAQLSFNNESFVFMGFMMNSKDNNPQYLGGKSSILHRLDRKVLAKSFNVRETTLDLVLSDESEKIIYDCTLCAEGGGGGGGSGQGRGGCEPRQEEQGRGGQGERQEKEQGGGREDWQEGQGRGDQGGWQEGQGRGGQGGWQEGQGRGGQGGWDEGKGRGGPTGWDEGQRRSGQGRWEEGQRGGARQGWQGGGGREGWQVPDMGRGAAWGGGGIQVY